MPNDWAVQERSEERDPITMPKPRRTRRRPGVTNAPDLPGSGTITLDSLIDGPANEGPIAY